MAAQGSNTVGRQSQVSAFVTPSNKDQQHQIDKLFKLVEKLQEKVEESDNRANSFEKFLNHSNPMGMSYVLQPGRSEVHLPVKFDGMKRN